MCSKKEVEERWKELKKIVNIDDKMKVQVAKMGSQCDYELWSELMNVIDIVERGDATELKGINWHKVNGNFAADFVFLCRNRLSQTNRGVWRIGFRCGKKIKKVVLGIYDYHDNCSGRSKNKKKSKTEAWKGEGIE